MSADRLRKDGTFKKEFLAGLALGELIELKADSMGKPVQESSVDLELSKRLAAEAPAELRRGTLRYRDAWKQWHARQFVLAPHALVYYKEAGKDEAGRAEGRMLLAGCAVNERQSKKETHCFKLTHRAKKKAHKGARMNSDYLILAADSARDAACWRAALATAITFSSAHKDAAARAAAEPAPTLDALQPPPASAADDSESETQADDEQSESSSKAGERAPAAAAAAGARKKKKKSVSGAATSSSGGGSGGGADTSDAAAAADADAKKGAARGESKDGGEAAPAVAVSGSDANDAASADGAVKPTTYEKDETPVPGRGGSVTEDLGSESKSIFMTLIKQVRPGMDLSKVVLPTFILEPRSMLEKLTDFMTHSDILMDAPKLNDPLERLLAVVKFYMSGFYIKPDGVKKPYNPIIGETFRCMWEYDDGSKTFYIAEQVSHHPPISAFYAQNRARGVVIDGSILFGSKFLGTSAASTLNGHASIHFVQHDEEYRFTFPDAHAKGFLVGPLVMELAGVTSITCETTGYRAELEFKTKPFWVGDYNMVSGKIKFGKETLYTIAGKWDERLTLTDASTKQTQELWSPEGKTPIPKWKPVVDEMEPKESDRLWAKVGAAIRSKDQKAATEEKYVLEQDQRALHKEMKQTGKPWVPRWFELDDNERWQYKWFAEGFKPVDVAQTKEVEMQGRIVALPRAGKAVSSSSSTGGGGGLGGDDSPSGSKSRRRRKASQKFADIPVTVDAPPSAAAVSPKAELRQRSSVSAIEKSSSRRASSMATSGSGGASSSALAASGDVRALQKRVERLEGQVTRLAADVSKNSSTMANKSLFDNKTATLTVVVAGLYVVSAFNILGLIFG